MLLVQTAVSQTSYFNISFNVFDSVMLVNSFIPWNRILLNDHSPDLMEMVLHGFHGRFRGILDSRLSMDLTSKSKS